MSPEMTVPFLLIELETITAMYCGNVAGGLVLFPELVVQLPAHAGAAEPSSNPLNPLGADPPLIGLFWDHCEPQK